MAKIFFTGSTEGLGRAAARTLIDEGHQVVLHARSRDRASALADVESRSAGVIIGDLGSPVETQSVAAQVNASCSTPTCACMAARRRCADTCRTSSISF